MWHSKHNGPYTAANERHHDRNSAQDWERMGMSCYRINHPHQFCDYELFVATYSGMPRFWVHPLEMKPSSGLLIRGPGPQTEAAPALGFYEQRSSVNAKLWICWEMLVPSERSGKGLHGRWNEGIARIQELVQGLAWELLLAGGNAWKCTAPSELPAGICSCLHLLPYEVHNHKKCEKAKKKFTHSENPGG